MNPPDLNRSPRTRDLELEDFTQEIDAPLADYLRGRDEPTLTRIDLEDIEIALDF